MEAIKVTKSLLRKEIKKKLSTLSEELKRNQSETIIKKLFGLKQFEDSKRISVYLSTKDEVSTEPILRRIFETNKLCFVPRYDGSVMEMVKLDSMKDYEQLPLTKWKIKQPELDENRENALQTGGLDLIIVPGVAFTADGKRLGHGKGYYDTFLSQLKKVQQASPMTIGLAFREQVLDDIPCNDDDVKIDKVLYPES